MARTMGISRIAMGIPREGAFQGSVAWGKSVRLRQVMCASLIDAPLTGPRLWGRSLDLNAADTVDPKREKFRARFVLQPV